MNSKELNDIILGGESSHVEFKRKFTSSEKIAKEISALANTKGGYIIFGVDDDGTIYGVESEKSEIDQIITASEFYLEPPVKLRIEIINLYNREIVVVHVSESTTKPHKVIITQDESYIKRAYLRVGDQSVIASREMSKVLEGQSVNAAPLKLSIGYIEKMMFRYLEKNQKATVKDFQQICNISRRRAERLLVRLVKAGVLQIHQNSDSDYFTLVGE